MSREIRRVPAKWKHPKKNNGHYEPLHDNYLGILKYYKEDVDRYITAITEVIEKGETKIYDNVFKSPQEVYDYCNEDNELLPSNPEGYMPNGEWYQLYEGVSEGTPLSPPFETKEELVEWLCENKDYWDRQWTRKQAEKMVEVGYSPSGIMTGGKFYDSVEALEI